MPDSNKQMTVDANSNVFVTGQSPGPGGVGTVMTTWKFNSSGALVWQSNPSGGYCLASLGSTKGYGAAIAVDPLGTFVYATGAVSGPNGYDMLTIRYDAATGQECWCTRYNNCQQNGDDVPVAIALGGNDAAPEVFVVGTSAGLGTGDDIVTIRYGNYDEGCEEHIGGNVVWLNRYNGNQNKADTAADISVGYVVVEEEGGGTSGAIRIAVLGTTYRTADSNPLQVGNDYVTTVFDDDLPLGCSPQEPCPPCPPVVPNKLPRWRKYFEGPGSDVAASMDFPPDPGLSTGSTVYVTGSGFNPGNNTIDYATLAYAASNGQPVWGTLTTAFWANGFGQGNDYARKIDVSSNLDQSELRVYVTGESYGPGTEGYNYGTVCYTNQPGPSPELWHNEIHGPVSAADDRATDLVGNVAASESAVYVTGRSHNGTNYDYMTVKFSSETGQQLWQSPVRFNNVSGVDTGHGIRFRFGTAGAFPDFWVLGRSTPGTGGSTNYTVVKYVQTP